MIASARSSATEVASFVQGYGGRRFAGYVPQPPMWGDIEDNEEEDDAVDLDVEVDRDAWEPITVDLPESWRARDWEGCPVRFVDGKDVGETITSLTAPGGYPVPVRLSEIGSVVVEVVDGTCRRVHDVTQRVVSMVTDVFPWGEVESFAAALQEREMTLLSAEPPGGQPSYDLEMMRKAAQNRSLTEMTALERDAVLLDSDQPTIVDGRLEPRLGGPAQANWPVFGVVKSHHRLYLHAVGMQVLYRLEPGQRTPAFTLPKAPLPVVTWYVRLAGGPGTMPNWGIVRIEAPLRWFTENHAWPHIDRLSRMVREYRCREGSYGRAPVSLHPIVRAEELLGALFTPHSILAGRFYRMARL